MTWMILLWKVKSILCSNSAETEGVPLNVRLEMVLVNTQEAHLRVAGG